jgi:hypothetical protein
LITEIRLDADERELRSLADWLRREPSLRTNTVSLKQAQARPGDMGGWVEAVQLVTDNGWQAASFVLSLMTWRQTRPAASPVTIRHGDIEVTLASGSPEEAARIADLLQQAGQDSAGADPGRPAAPDDGSQGQAGPQQ